MAPVSLRATAALFTDFLRKETQASTYMAGTFTDAPVLHPDSPAMGKGKLSSAPERCEEPAR